ncbi:EutN/CcmL family microcompartment protein [Oceanotoga sp. DSM 15011]|jgi:ethanolamine utilization protein EutN|uniref:Ethanolamine utilization protein EutN n=1 Tax=Oceanotoga teriensis TaxID=515440 RepID=A0AA45C8E7_9BACT|nr:MULTISPECIES: EutN/CcmL family microcompartment protein [Oceanotoga]MDN5341192.1 ethanolamine utilization protein EutN [Oceanotoga sp.]MDO7976873.1 EutN/CcmL family microcompartment protein [Oceanotoga teriensis]PWJ95953.1 ethanolamine utilization protein EutN [Oceanotoga teriensis]UYP00824.1 EutN/CcmL family microcompartment protein [Oceanotoga sp. DSM 15011]
MIIAKVIGNIWATRKDEKLNGFKFLVVKQCNTQTDNQFVAADMIGAGIGDTVLITKGSSARNSLENTNIPIDAVIVGIIDSLEVDEGLLK